jgi:hypothetical protein
MKYLEGAGFDVISVQLGVTVGSVRPLNSKGLANARNEMSQPALAGF